MPIALSPFFQWQVSSNIHFLLEPCPIIAMPCQTLSNVFFPLSRPILRLHISLNKCCWLSKSAQLPTVLNAFGNVFHKHIKMKKLYSSDTNMICNILNKKANHFNFSLKKYNEFWWISQKAEEIGRWFPDFYSWRNDQKFEKNISATHKTSINLLKIL